MLQKFDRLKFVKDGVEVNQGLQHDNEKNNLDATW